MSYASAATPVHVRVNDAMVDRFAWFNDCVFLNTGTSLTQAIDSNIADTTARKILITGKSVSVGADDIADATGDGTIWTKPETATANAALLGINVAVS
jgi:hypothetical protein